MSRIATNNHVVCALWCGVLSATVCGTGCKVAVATIELLVHEPPNSKLVERAVELPLAVLVDGSDVGATLTDTKVPFVVTIERADESDDVTHHDVSFVLATKTRAGVSQLSGLGRSALFTVPTARDVQNGSAQAVALTVPLLLATPNGISSLLLSLPGARRLPTVCTDVTGRAWVLGSGVSSDGDTAKNGYVFDSTTLAIADDSKVTFDAPWLSGDCIVVDGVPLLFGGCDANNASSDFFFRIVDGALVSAGSPAPSGGCGARVREAGNGRVLLVSGLGVVDLRAADGAQINRRASVTERHFADAATLLDNTVVLTRGFDGLTAGRVVHTAEAVDPDNLGVSTTLPALNDAWSFDRHGVLPPFFLMQGAGGAFTLSTLQTVDAELQVVRGVTFEDFVPSEFVVVGANNRVAAIGERISDGQSAFVLDGLAPVLTARDRIAVGPSDALLLFGGGAAGVDVVVVEDLTR